MKKNSKLFIITSIVFLVLDGLWLGFFGLPLYQKEIGHLLKSVLIAPAVIFYVAYVIALMVFVIRPNWDKPTLLPMIAYGFFFGVICYGTYDLTNMATLKDWSWAITSVDIIWGGFVTASTVGLSSIIYKKVVK